MSVTSGVSDNIIATREKVRGKIGQTKVQRFWPGKALEWAEEAEERALEELVRRRLEERKVERKMDKEIEKNVQLEANIDDIDTDDEMNEAEEYESWKGREISRIKMDREDSDAVFKEKEEIKKVRNMTEEERRVWERRNPKPAQHPSGNGNNIYTCGFSAPNGEDKMDTPCQ